jgi:hypothetical protein
VTKQLLLAGVLAACHRPSVCERFAELEAKCGESNQHEQQTTRTLARGICEAANSADPDVAKAGAVFAKQAECAEQIENGDCNAYNKKCRDTAK